MASAVDEPLVAHAVARATRARLDFLRRIFIELGLPDDEAGERAWLAYAFYIGHHQLSRNPEARALRAPGGFDDVVRLLTAPSTRQGH